MTKPIESREQVIAQAITREPGDVPDNTHALWERLAVVLTALIGDVGFQSLFNRSLHKSRVSFPWLGGHLSHQSAESRFLDLTTSLRTQDAPEATSASTLLLNTFMSILATLIGEFLTTSILDAALDVDTRNATSAELNNE
jgi:hypothetical protein